MTVSLIPLSLIITQKNCMIIILYVPSQNYNTESIITSACSICFNTKQKKKKRKNHPLRAFKEVLLNYQKKITFSCRTGQNVVSSVSMKNGIDTVTENSSCIRHTLSKRRQKYLFQYTCAVSHAASSEQCYVCVYICSCYV